MVILGELIKDGAIDVDILGSTEDSCSNVNDCSVVLKVSIGSMDFLLMGDAEAPGEADLLATGANVGAEILKVGHHGSSTSTTAQLLAAADPEYAVISVGAGNSYGHPAASTLAALAAAGSA